MRLLLYWKFILALNHHVRESFFDYSTHQFHAFHPHSIRNSEWFRCSLWNGNSVRNPHSHLTLPHWTSSATTFLFRGLKKVSLVGINKKTAANGRWWAEDYFLWNADIIYRSPISHPVNEIARQLYYSIFQWYKMQKPSTLNRSCQEPSRVDLWNEASISNIHLLDSAWCKNAQTGGWIESAGGAREALLFREYWQCNAGIIGTGDIEICFFGAFLKSGRFIFQARSGYQHTHFIKQEGCSIATHIVDAVASIPPCKVLN